jgi:hypothetical protein
MTVVTVSIIRRLFYFRNRINELHVCLSVCLHVLVPTPNTTANVRLSLSRLDKRAVHAMRKKRKLASDGGDSGSKKCKRGYGGVWRSLRLAGVWSQAVGFMLVRLAGIWLQSP